MKEDETTVQNVTLEDPMEGGESLVKGVRSGANMYGAFSIQNFCQAGALDDTHEDTQGWLNYVSKFTPPNFWYKDCGVRIWAYYEDYDNWQNTYGMDAVCAVYHSGHGGMDTNGVFYASLGCDWAQQHDCTAVSSKMRLGNEHVRYIFWSACFSVRVLDGHSPIRTWGPTNLGWRMIFGYETTTWDDPNSGKFFWEEWSKNKSFSTAWLDASWRVAHDQAPSVVACGANAQDAKDRVYNERFFSTASVDHSWYWWRWYYASTVSRKLLRSLPEKLQVARLKPAHLAAQPAHKLAADFEMDLKVPKEGIAAPDGSFNLRAGDKNISYSSEGLLDVQFGKPNLANQKELSTQSAITRAQDALQRYKLGQEGQVVLDRVLQANEGGGTETGSGQMEGPYTIAKTVQFRQVINGLPVITPGLGTVRVTVDNDGTVTNVHSSVREIEQMSDRSISPSDAPPPPGMSDMPKLVTPEPTDPADYEQKLAAEFGKRLTGWAIRGRAPVAVTTVPDSTEVGYDIRGNEAVLVAQKAVEVDFGGGYRKRYWVRVPLEE